MEYGVVSVTLKDMEYYIAGPNERDSRHSANRDFQPSFPIHAGKDIFRYFHLQSVRVNLLLKHEK